MAHEFQRSAVSYACGAVTLLYSRIQEVKKKGRTPVVIHITEALAMALADEVLPKELQRTLPNGARLTVNGGQFDGVPVYRCADPCCTLGDVFIMDPETGEAEPI